MSTNDFIIFKVAWLTNTPGNENRRDKILEHFQAVMEFLVKNRLLVNISDCNYMKLDDDFTLQSSDLTEDGLEVMRTAYHKWLAKVDNGMSAEDVTLLDKALKRIQRA